MLWYDRARLNGAVEGSHHALWALMHGYVALYRAGRFKLSPKQFRELCTRALDRLFDGLAC